MGNARSAASKSAPRPGMYMTLKPLMNLKKRSANKPSSGWNIWSAALNSRWISKPNGHIRPFGSSLLEGPIETGRDMIEGGCWYTGFGVLVSGSANVGDSLGVIDTLIYKEKRITWDQLIEALEHNWKGYERLQQMVINEVPKYGNDNDYADSMVCFRPQHVVRFH